MGGILLFVIGSLGGLILSGVFSPFLGAAWFSFWTCAAIVNQLVEIDRKLSKQQSYFDWHMRIENHRFEHDHPGAFEKQRAAAVKADQQKAAERVAREAEAAAKKAEAERRAKEPTFVARELTPDLPADFRTTKATQPVDFSAIEDVAKPSSRRSTK